MMMIMKSLHGWACTSYLSDACQLASEASRRLRSSGHRMHHTMDKNSVWMTGRLMPADRGFGINYQLHCGQLTVSSGSRNS